jgi:hypothetical protein
LGFMLMWTFWSIALPGNEVGGCWTIAGTLAKLWRGEAGRRLRDPERENEALAVATGCWRGVMSSSMSSWMLSIAPPVVALLSYQLGERGGGTYPSSCTILNGERTLAGEQCMGEGESEPPEGGLADCRSKPRLAELTLGNECARVMGGAASEEPPERDRTCGRE